MQKKQKQTQHPTLEQQAIIDTLLNKQNIVVNAVAGSGKTSLILFFAKTLLAKKRNEKILLLTYNNALNKDTQKRIKKNKLDKTIKSYTFDGLATYLHIHYFQGLYKSKTKYIKNDQDWLEVFFDELKNANKEKLAFFFNNFSYLVIDEAQDLKINYMLFIKYIVHLNPELCILVVGDEKQMIYDFGDFFKRANINYFKNFHYFMNLPAFQKMPLSQTFRVPKHMCDFLNKDILKNNYINNYANINDDEAVSWYMYDPQNYEAVHNFIKDFITKQIEQEKASINDFAILEFGKSQTRNKEFSNFLSEKGFNMYFKTDKEEKLSKLRLNKLEFTTVWQLKGREKKYIICWNFDDVAWNNWIDTSPLDKLPNAWYVAFTRAKTKTLIFSRDFLPEFLNHKPNNEVDLKQITINSDFSAQEPYVKHNDGLNEKNILFNPSVDLDNISANLICQLNLYKTGLIKKHEYGSYMLEFPNIIKYDEAYYESSYIASMYLLYEYLIKKDLTLFKKYIYSMECFLNKKQLHNLLNYENFDLQDKMKTCLMIKCLSQNLNNDMIYCKNYWYMNDFSDSKQINKVFASFDQFNLTNLISLEYPIEIHILTNKNKDVVMRIASVNKEEKDLYSDLTYKNLNLMQNLHIWISARTDLIAHDKVLELKCKNELNNEAHYQLIAYLFIINNFRKTLIKKYVYQTNDYALIVDFAQKLVQFNEKYKVECNSSKLLQYLFSMDEKTKQLQITKFIQQEFAAYSHFGYFYLKEILYLYSKYKEAKLNFSFKNFLAIYYPLYQLDFVMKEGILLNYKTGEYFIYKNDSDVIDFLMNQIFIEQINNNNLTSLDLEKSLEKFAFYEQLYLIKPEKNNEH